MTVIIIGIFAAAMFALNMLGSVVLVLKDAGTKARFQEGMAIGWLLIVVVCFK